VVTGLYRADQAGVGNEGPCLLVGRRAEVKHREPRRPVITKQSGGF